MGNVKGRPKVKYCVSAPNSVDKDAEKFRKKLKEKKKIYKKLYKLKKVTVRDVKECTFVLVFCPIVSRAGTDIDAKLNEIERDFKEKSVILIVLHHTFDPERIVSDSSKFVKSRNKPTLTLDVLFHEDKGLLECERNSEALEAGAHWIHSEIQGAKDSTEKDDEKQENQMKDPVKPSGASQL